MGCKGQSGEKDGGRSVKPVGDMAGQSMQVQRQYFTLLSLAQANCFSIYLNG
jgi:hypothetical protein